MRKRLISFILYGAITLIIGGIYDHFFGTNAFLLSLLGVSFLFVIVQKVKAWRAEKTISQIDDIDERPVRVNCAVVHSAQFIAIGLEHGWSAELLEGQSSDEVSIRFKRLENASSVKALLRAFTKAGLVQNIRA